MKPLSELEWLGVELALDRFFLSHKAHAQILARLLRRAGLTVRTQCLVDGSTFNEGSVKIYVCRLRESLADLGMPPLIEGVRGGYRIPEWAAAQILSRVHTALEHLMAA